MKYYLLVFATLLFTQSIFAKSTYITEDYSVHLRTGPSIKYRITGVIDSGDSVTILDRKSSRYFYKIKTKQGLQGWVPSKQIKSGTSKKETIMTLENSVSDSVSLIKKQANEIHRLKGLLNQQKTENFNQSNKQELLTTQIDLLSSQINSLDDSNLIRWLTHTGVITIFAIAMIILITVARKRKNYNEIH